MPLPDWLLAFGERCRAALPGAAVTAHESGLTVRVEGREVQVDADRDDPDRVALWTALDSPPGMTAPQVADAAMRYSAARLFQAGCVMGFNAKARLLMLGRSVERLALDDEGAAGLLHALAAEIAQAEAALAGPVPSPAMGGGATDPRFAAYVREALAAQGIAMPELKGNRLLLQVAERWLEVIFDPGSARLVFVGITALGDAIRSELLGQFNCYNLMHGGYGLISPPETGCIYLVQAHAMERLPAAGLLPALVGFEVRAGAAGTWYLTYDEVVAPAAA